ncbi:MAG: hypothetical protein E7260_12800 [Lachnospiraceae bacterium]|nr:hypothetical protein [Lachnospiraceae bacterium]
MKNLKLKMVIVALLLMTFACGLIGCAKPFDAATVVAGFENKVDTTVKLNYVTNYKVDVVRPGADASGMDSFKRDVVATAVVEMDLGADLYIKVSKTRQDKLIDATAVKTEEVLYKKDGKYFYQTSSAAAVEVSDPSAQLAAIFENATYEQIGGLTLDALVYDSLDKDYELKVFGLSETFLAEDLADPTYAEGTNGGLVVNYKPEYIGYRTDGGWSDFSNATDGYAADVEIVTNEKGFVTSMKENYNSASLVFNIMSNPPTVTITGERSFTATYGEAISKVEAVDFAASKAVYADAVGGTFAVMTCAMGDFGNMAQVANGGALELGKIICVKPAANEGYEVAKVVVNGSETPMTDPAMAGGFYCFAVNPGDNTIEVLFKETDPTAGVVTVKNNTANTYELQSFTYAGAPSDYKVITDGIIEPGAAIFGAIVIDSTKEVVVTVNGVETSVNIPAGPTTFYCFAVKTGGKYDVVISEKGAAPVSGNGIVTVTNNTNYEYQVQSFTYAGAPTDYKVIENGEIEPGASIFGAIVISVDTPVSVVVNGTPTSVNIPANGVVFYCFAVKEAGEFNVVINPAE